MRPSARLSSIECLPSHLYRRVGVEVGADVVDAVPKKLIGGAHRCCEPR